VSGIDGEAVRDVQQRVRVRGELPALRQPERGPHEALPTKGRARGAQRTGDHEEVAGTGTCAARHALRTADGADAQHEPV
jgi:hypothetical protein